MNYQFFATAGVITGVLFLILLISFVLLEADCFSWDVQDIIGVIIIVIILIIIAFWVSMTLIVVFDKIYNLGIIIY